MCGIFGFVSNQITHPGEAWHFADKLFAITQSRGRHASGFSAMAGNEFITDKKPMSADCFVKTSRAWRSLRKHNKVALIGHTRLATSGPPKDNINNHPFHGPRYSIAHNGGISNFEMRAHRKGFNLVSKCDSEILLHYLESGENVDEGIYETFSDLDSAGWMAICALERAKGIVHLYKDSASPCHLVSIPRWNMTVFCSELGIIMRAAEETLGSQKRADDEAIIIFTGGIPSYTRITINEDGELTEKSFISLKNRRRISWRNNWRNYVSDDIESEGIEDSSSVTNLEDTHIIDMNEFNWTCVRCSNPVEMANDRFCKFCDAEETGSLPLLIADELKAIHNLHLKDTTKKYIPDLSGDDEEEKEDGPKDYREKKFTSYLEAYAYRNPKEKMADEDATLYLKSVSYEDSFKDRIWDNINRKRADFMAEGEWRAYLMWMRDKVSKKLGTTPQMPW